MDMFERPRRLRTTPVMREMVAETSVEARHLITPHFVVEGTGFKDEIIWDTTKPNGQPRRMLDVSRAKEYFGFEARVEFDEGLRRTVEWWKGHRAETR